VNPIRLRRGQPEGRRQHKDAAAYHHEEDAIHSDVMMGIGFPFPGQYAFSGEADPPRSGISNGPPLCRKLLEMRCQVALKEPKPARGHV
jgi:hypothetical protein